jgi:hypothetical protein
VAKRQIKRLKGASRLDAAIRGMAGIVDLGGLGAVEVVHTGRRGLPATSAVRRGGWARGPVLPASKVRTSYEGIRIEDARGMTLTVHDVVVPRPDGKDEVALGGKGAIFRVSAADDVSAVGDRADARLDA